MILLERGSAQAFWSAAHRRGKTGTPVESLR